MFYGHVIVNEVVFPFRLLQEKEASVKLPGQGSGFSSAKRSVLSNTSH